MFQATVDKNIVNELNALSANPIKWSNTLKQFVGKFPTNCLSVFDHFVILALKGLKSYLGRYSDSMNITESKFYLGSHISNAESFTN